MHYIKRWMEKKIQAAYDLNPVVVLTGPRQVGKSTLLKHAAFFKSWRYLTLDDPDTLEQAQTDPKSLLADHTPTIIDEAQRCPKLLLTVKYFVDQTQRQRKFLLSGSGNISLRHSPRETLAGRVSYIHLSGFCFRELAGQKQEGLLDLVWQNKELPSTSAHLKTNLLSAIWRGGLPGVLLASNDTVARGRGLDYIDTYLHRDIQDLVKIRYPQHFRRLMELLAQATGWESVQETLAQACGETRTNVSRYISLLQDTSLLYALPGYTHKAERAYRHAKYYWFDSGSACLLAGIHTATALKKTPVKGRYFENFIFQHLYAWAAFQAIPPSFFYWQPKSKDAEVDFVIHSSQGGLAIEVKSSDTLSFKDTKSMRAFLQSHPEVNKGILIYTGHEVLPIASNIYAVPWTMI